MFLIQKSILKQLIVAFLTGMRQVQRFLEHDGQNRLSFKKRQLFTADKSRYVVNEFCSRQMKSY